MFQRAPALGRVFGVLDEHSHIVEKADAPHLVVHGGHVRFENVSFQYSTGWGAVQNVSFDAKPGETMVVGPTVSGKSTLLGLLQRVYDPEQGRILIDGQDLRDVSLASLRASVGVVFQEAGLFNRSIRENIAMGDPATRTTLRVITRCFSYAISLSGHSIFHIRSYIRFRLSANVN